MNVEIANTPRQRETGLMFRKTLGQNNGMLFVFDKDETLHFWGQNTYIPLDIAFINDKKEIVAIKEIAPMSTRMIGSETPCKYALEANSRYFIENGISIGDSIELDGDNIVFLKKIKE